MACIERKGRHDRCTVVQAVMNFKHDDFPNVSVVKVGRGGSYLAFPLERGEGRETRQTIQWLYGLAGISQIQ